jgi:di/tricarboxylate transporter
MFDPTIVLVLLGAAILMFAINRPRLDVVALIMLLALPFTGVLTISEALAGFSDPNIVLTPATRTSRSGSMSTNSRTANNGCA